MDQIEQAYRVLELALDTPTSMREVNQAYKDLVFIWHPDRIPSDRERLREKAEAKLKTLNEARSFLRSQAKNGRLPAVTTAKKEASRTSPYSQNSHKNGNRNGSRTSAYSRSNRTYSTYRPGDDSTYRPSRDRATARSTYTQAATANGDGNTRGSGYRPPYEAYRRAAAAASSGFAGQYGATYRARYPSSPWPRQSESAHSSATAKSTDKASANTADKASSKATGKTASKATSSKATSAKGTASKGSSKTVSKDTKKKSTTQSSTTQSSRSSERVSTASDSYQPARTKRNPDLSGVNMSGANLKEKDFSGRNLSGADLSGADLSDTFMHKVNLNRANLRKARLFRANLLQADLSHADLSGADLIGADLSGADLSGADLSGAKVGYGDKIMVKLLGARLTGTIMPNGRIHE